MWTVSVKAVQSELNESDGRPPRTNELRTGIRPPANERTKAFTWPSYIDFIYIFFTFFLNHGELSPPWVRIIKCVKVKYQFWIHHCRRIVSWTSPPLFLSFVLPFVGVFHGDLVRGDDDVVQPLVELVDNVTPRGDRQTDRVIDRYQVFKKSASDVMSFFL